MSIWGESIPDRDQQAQNVNLECAWHIEEPHGASRESGAERTGERARPMPGDTAWSQVTRGLLNRADVECDSRKMALSWGMTQGDACFKRIITTTLWRTDYILEPIYCCLKELCGLICQLTGANSEL